MSANQHDKIEALCAELRLADVAQSYRTLTQQASGKDWSYSDVLEAVINAEREARRIRTQATLTRMAGFLAIKTLTESISRLQPASRTRGLKSWRHWLSSNVART